MSTERLFELIVFDCDGVLVDTERHIEAVDLRLISELGWPITAEEIHAEHLGRPTPAVLANIERHIGRPVPEDFRARRKRAYLDSIATGLEPVPGAGEVVEAMVADGYQVCVASSGSRETIESSLCATGLRDRFGHKVFSIDDVASGKPDPDLFLHAAMTLKVPPRECLVVEDSPAGVAAAAAARMAVVGVADRTPAHLLTEADHVISELRDLPVAVRRLTDQ